MLKRHAPLLLCAIALAWPAVSRGMAASDFVSRAVTIAEEIKTVTASGSLKKYAGSMGELIANDTTVRHAYRAALNGRGGEILRDMPGYSPTRSVQDDNEIVVVGKRTFVVQDGCMAHACSDGRSYFGYEPASGDFFGLINAQGGIRAFGVPDYTEAALMLVTYGRHEVLAQHGISDNLPFPLPPGLQTELRTFLQNMHG